MPSIHSFNYSMNMIRMFDFIFIPTPDSASIFFLLYSQIRWTIIIIKMPMTVRHFTPILKLNWIFLVWTANSQWLPQFGHNRFSMFIVINGVKLNRRKWTNNKDKITNRDKIIIFQQILVWLYLVMCTECLLSCTIEDEINKI